MKKKLLIIAGILVVVLVAVVVIVAMSIGSIIKKGVETVGPEVAKVKMTLDGANLSIVGGHGTMSGLFIGNPEGYKTESAMKVGKAHLAIAPASLMSDKIVIRSIQLEAPEITIEGGLKENNLTQIQKNIEAFIGVEKSKPAETQTPTEKEAMKKLQIDEFVLTGAKVNVALSMLGGKPLSITIPEIRLSNLGQGPEGITAADLADKLTGRLISEIAPLAQKAAEDLLKQGADALKKTATDAATKSLGDLFKKKP
jgi:uncharacterized protein involved in outer membrane biogenesis